MAFRKDYTNVKGVYLDGSLECLYILDHLAHHMRDERCAGLFCCRCDPETHESYYTFYDYEEHFPFGSYVYLEKDTNTIFIELENRLVGFNLDYIKQLIKEKKDGLYNR
jgi:hypothetical protein